jgi:phosphotransferase system  glucose/maltose/N-acetylglucosamine-specific IIC component
MRDLTCYAKVSASATIAGLFVAMLYSSNSQFSGRPLFASVVLGILVVAALWSWIKPLKTHSPEQQSPIHSFEFYLESLIWGYLRCLTSIWVYWGVFNNVQISAWFSSPPEVVKFLWMSLFMPLWFAPLIVVGSPLLITCWEKIHHSNHVT